MSEIGPSHPHTYRKELVAPLFELIKAYESCVIIGAASMGKSRLIQFILRPDIQQHYMSDEAQRHLLIWVDCNRMNQAGNDWSLYELILTGLTESIGDMPAHVSVRERLLALRKELILEPNALYAQRTLELAVHMLIREHNLQLCIILDEFDDSYKKLPAQALANLRALRDMHKYKLSYTLFMRDHPANLRSTEEKDVEGFYEKISRSVLGLTPYNKDDTIRIIDQIAERRHSTIPLTTETKDTLVCLSGGHPGLLENLMDSLIRSQPMGMTWEEWLQDQPNLEQECDRIWLGLRPEEQQTLNHIANDISTGFRERDLLLTKGLIKSAGEREYAIFSPIFHQYAANKYPVQSEQDKQQVRVDTQAGLVYINNQQTEPLTPKEYSLLEALYEHAGEICSSELLIKRLYPEHEQLHVNENNITTLIRRIRKKIEPNSSRPQYLVNVKGRGYRLVVSPGG
ncbi:MAG: winged helix-turn-helix domain-containing protein [Chloroflexota bacterium]